MENLNIYQKILRGLTEANPDLVEDIKKSRKSSNEYPKNTYLKVFENLSNNLELQKQFKEEESLNGDKMHFYDLIFHIDDTKDNTDTDETKFYGNYEGSNEEIDYTPSITDSDSVDLIYYGHGYGDESSSDIPFEYSSQSSDASPEEVEQNKENDEENVKLSMNIMIIDVKSFKSGQTAKIQKISKLLSISDDSSYFLLKKFNWNIDMLLKKWKTIQPEISEWIISKNNFINMNIGKGFCQICCNDDCDLYQLYCGHSLCLNCIKNEILMQIRNFEFPVICRCDNCKSEILVHEIQHFCGDEIAREYSDRYIEHQMFLDDQLVKCSSADCKSFLNIKESKYCNIGKCQCGKYVCLECHKDSHAPLRCDQVDKWNQICTEMMQLSIDQQNWLNHESHLVNYRKNHLNEVQNAFYEYKKRFIHDHNEQDQKKIDEINDLNEKIQNEKKEELILNLKQKIIDMKLALEFNQKQRQRDLENFEWDVEDFMKSVKSNQIVTSLDAVGYNTQKQKFEKLVIKNCPKCDAFIYKDGGCNHVKCKICNHEFCWVCLKDWNGHNGGYYECKNANIRSNNKNHNNNSNSNNNINNNNNDDDNLFIQSLIASDIEYYKDIDDDDDDTNDHCSNRASQILKHVLARDIDDDSDNNEENHANQQEHLDQAAPPDHEFVLPPMNAELKPQYNQWRIIVGKCEKYTNEHESVLQMRSKMSPFFQNTIKNAFAVLMNGYKLLFMLETGSFKFRKLEFLINDLEYYYKGMAYGEPPSVEFADACNNSIENLLVNANFFNY